MFMSSWIAFANQIIHNYAPRGNTVKHIARVNIDHYILNRKKNK